VENDVNRLSISKNPCNQHLNLVWQQYGFVGGGVCFKFLKPFLQC
jgi:hypothetical protein